jgi:hypothetical protein
MKMPANDAAMSMLSFWGRFFPFYVWQKKKTFLITKSSNDSKKH